MELEAGDRGSVDGVRMGGDAVDPDRVRWQETGQAELEVENRRSVDGVSTGEAGVGVVS